VSFCERDGCLVVRLRDGIERAVVRAAGGSDLAQEEAEGVSLVTFGGFNVLQLLGVLHGAFEHDWSLAVGMAVSLCTCGSVTILALIYRGRAGVPAV